MNDDRKLLANIRRRVNRARKFPVNTCPASRHLHMIADALASKRPYPMLTEEPEHCAITMYSVLESLWTLRTKHPATEREKAAILKKLNKKMAGSIKAAQRSAN